MKIFKKLLMVFALLIIIPVTINAAGVNYKMEMYQLSNDKNVIYKDYKEFDDGSYMLATFNGTTDTIYISTFDNENQLTSTKTINFDAEIIIINDKSSFYAIAKEPEYSITKFDLEGNALSSNVLASETAAFPDVYAAKVDNIISIVAITGSNYNLIKVDENCNIVERVKLSNTISDVIGTFNKKFIVAFAGSNDYLEIPMNWDGATLLSNDANVRTLKTTPLSNSNFDGFETLVELNDGSAIIGYSVNNSSESGIYIAKMNADYSFAKKVKISEYSNPDIGYVDRILTDKTLFCKKNSENGHLNCDIYDSNLGLSGSYEFTGSTMIFKENNAMVDRGIYVDLSYGGYNIYKIKFLNDGSTTDSGSTNTDNGGTTPVSDLGEESSEDIVNPNTGRFISLAIVGTLTIFIVGVGVIVKKKNKLYKL